MKLTLDKLAAHLGRGTGPLYVIAGDEPLLMDEALGLIRDAVRRAGCGEREIHVAERGFNWDAFAAGLQNLSLFASRRFVELRLPTGKPGDAGARYLTTLADQPDSGNLVVIVLPGLDSATTRSKWATALAGAAVWVEVRSPRREQLPEWLRRRVGRAGLTIDDEALDLLAARVEGNLLAAQQEIDKLALLLPDGRVTAGAIRDSVADGARFDVFQLSDAALSGDAGRAVRILHGLQREGAAEVLVLWSLARDIISLADIVLRVAQGHTVEQALADSGAWRSRHDLFRQAARARSVTEVSRLVAGAARADQILKGARDGQSWNALLEVVLGLARAPLLRAATA
jgi:DNA polymerase-3 subunit delta